MANYSGKSPLGMICPHCREYGEHPVEKTDPKWYYWDKEATKLFTDLYGKDISYRLRTKRCVHCNKSFKSAELDRDFLAGLVQTVLKWNRTIQSNKELLEQQEETIRTLRTALRTIRKITLKNDSRKV